MSKLNRITAKFNIFDNGRKYTGQKRGYVLDNWKAAINNKVVQERIALGEMVGYVGHGYRKLTGKLMPEEMEVANMPNGSQIVLDADPSHRCVELSIDDAGNVTHTEEVFDNDQGKRVMGFHNSKFGGFSVAAAPASGSSSSRTLIDMVYGFDYVNNPNFAENRGYILDDASDAPSRDNAIKALSDAGIDSAEAVFDGWVESDGAYYKDAIFDAEDKLIDSQITVGEQEKDIQLLSDKIEELEKRIEDQAISHDNAILDSASHYQQATTSLESQLKADHSAEIEKMAVTRSKVMQRMAAQSPVAIPDAVLDSLSSAGDVAGMKPFLDFLSKAAKIDASDLPIGNHTPHFVAIIADDAGEDIQSPEFGIFD